MRIKEIAGDANYSNKASRLINYSHLSNNSFSRSEKYYRPRKMKTKSVSAEDLRQIVRQMINGALGDNEQMSKFHRAIYEEWYYKRMAELEESNVQDDLTEALKSEDEDISATVAHRRTRKHKYKRQTSQSLIETDRQNSKEIEKDSETDILQNCSQHTPVSVNIDLPEKPSKEKINSTEEDRVPEIIEIWNNPTQRFKAKDKPIGDRKQANEESARKQEANEKLSFETWKRRKTAAYRKLFKEKRKEKEQALRAKLAEMERKRIALKEQARIREQQEHERNKKLSKKYNEMVKRNNMEDYQSQVEAKRIINEKAFKSWKKQKDIKLKQERMMMQLTEHYGDQHQKERVTEVQYTECVDVKFDSWLNQLDWVLHEKYLRERRHLVRSFYCQPVYYGDANR